MGKSEIRNPKSEINPNYKFQNLQNILKNFGSFVVAYSGGLDSTFLLKCALDALGPKNVLAVTARSETYPFSEYKEAKRIAKSLGARHITITTKELESEKFRSNPVNRCYYCKRELFSKLDTIRRKNKIAFIIDGTNFDDLKDIRHGRKAAFELGVRSPLLEARLGKADIRRFSKALKLSTHDKPSFACLASRIPVDNKITTEKLSLIDRAEEYLKTLGLRQVRVRLHGDIARIEVEQCDFARAIKCRGAIVKRLKALGFVYVALDLAGYRTGSMHEAAGS